MNKRITPRMVEILEEIINHGYDLKRISLNLCISHSTLRTHMNVLFRRLEVHCITDAVVEAIRRGVVRV